uniref:Uncharacterized protein n=1 Tax=Polytomella parva TaxID=51329 RepID=A0A7S0YLF3_9CHLO|mmetsp:Transcript_32122/g.58466  ORF Transcript_32122/g.58466 Transcript_32122/m.58466 type:complete len:105 (+) Transcript_32122:282-596(+)
MSMLRTRMRSSMISLAPSQSSWNSVLNSRKIPFHFKEKISHGSGEREENEGKGRGKGRNKKLKKRGGRGEDLGKEREGTKRLKRKEKGNHRFKKGVIKDGREKG